MEYKRTVIEDNASLFNIVHVYTCSEENRESVLEAIKEKHPGLDIEVLINGYRVREIKKKTEEEKLVWFQKNKPAAKKIDDSWEQEVANIAKKKKR